MISSITTCKGSKTGLLSGTVQYCAFEPGFGSSQQIQRKDKLARSEKAGIRDEPYMTTIQEVTCHCTQAAGSHTFSEPRTVVMSDNQMLLA